MKRGKKKEENYIERGEKVLKNAFFWAINSKNWLRLPQTYLSGIKINLKKGGGEMIKMHSIYPCNNISRKELEGLDGPE